jgi:hypothetical protein
MKLKHRKPSKSQFGGLSKKSAQKYACQTHGFFLVSLAVLVRISFYLKQRALMVPKNIELSHPFLKC